MLTKELKIAGAICAAIIGRIMYKNFKKEISENYEEEVEKFVDSKMPEPSTEIVKEYEDLEEKRKDILNQEGKEVILRVNKWKKSNGIDTKLEELNDKAREELATYISDNDFNSKKNALRVELGKKVAEYDKENGITKTIESLKKQINDAKKDYDNNKTLSNVFSDEEAAKEFRKAAKKQRNRVVESAEAEIKDLSTKFDEYKKDIGKEYSDKIDEIDNKIDAKRQEINKRYSSMEDGLQNAVVHFREGVRLAVINERSEETKGIVAKHDELKPLYTEIKKNRKDLKDDILSNSNFEIMTGVYLHNKGWTKFGVYGVGMIPVCGLIFVGAKYFSWLKEFAEFVDKGGVVSE